MCGDCTRPVSCLRCFEFVRWFSCRSNCIPNPPQLRVDQLKVGQIITRPIMMAAVLSSMVLGVHELIYMLPPTTARSELSLMPFHIFSALSGIPQEQKPTGSRQESGTCRPSGRVVRYPHLTAVAVIPHSKEHYGRDIVMSSEARLRCERPLSLSELYLCFSPRCSLMLQEKAKAKPNPVILAPTLGGYFSNVLQGCLTLGV